MTENDEQLTLEEWKQRALEVEERLSKLDSAPAGSHHGDPVLTKRDISLLEAHAKWLRILCMQQTKRFVETSQSKQWGSIRQFMIVPGYPDWVKSRLFWRIRSGKEPLEYPPPTCYSCPWYELIEVPEPHETADTIREVEGKMHIAQSSYDILGRDGDKWILGFGPYRFRAWNGPVIRKRMTDIHQEDGNKYVEYKDVCGWIEYTGTEKQKEGQHASD